MEDALIKEAREHGHISEMMAFFQRSYPLVNSGKGLEPMVALGEFFKKYIIAHFNYEDREVFPHILKQGLATEKKFIRSLEAEHAAILADVEAFLGFLEKAQVDPARAAFGEMETLSQKIIVRVLRHSSREDADLFPLIKKYIP